VLRHLAGPAGDDVLVAFPAGLRIERRSETIRDVFDFFEYEAVVVERPQRDDDCLR
jgi:hypothetical protein